MYRYVYTYACKSFPISLMWFIDMLGLNTDTLTFACLATLYMLFFILMQNMPDVHHIGIRYSIKRYRMTHIMQ